MWTIPEMEMKHMQTIYTVLYLTYQYTYMYLYLTNRFIYIFLWYPDIYPDQNKTITCFHLKEECSVDALRACVFIYLLYILKNNVEFRRK